MRPDSQKQQRRKQRGEIFFLLVFLIFFGCADRHERSAQTQTETTTEPKNSPRAASPFHDLPDSELLRLKNVAENRVQEIEDYTLALYGKLPDTDTNRRGSALMRFLGSSRSTRYFIATNFEPLSSSIQNGGISLRARCARYFNVFDQLLRRIGEYYLRLPEFETGSKEALLIRTQIEILHLQALKLIELSKNKSEGGMILLTQEPQSCEILNREEWSQGLEKLKIDLKELELSYWGQRGVKNPLPISYPLSQILAHEADREYKLFLPKLIGETALFIFASEVAFVRFALPLLRTQKFWSKSLTRYAPALISAAIGGTASYFALRNRYPAKKIIAGEWEQTLSGIEYVLSLDLSSDQNAIFQISILIEDPISNMNLQVVKAYQQDMFKAYNRFGSLDKARSVTLMHLKEIEEVMKARLWLDSASR